MAFAALILLIAAQLVRRALQDEGGGQSREAAAKEPGSG